MFNTTLPKGVAAVAATLITLTLSACSPSQIERAFIGQKQCTGGPKVLTVTDTSGSTRHERAPAGLYESGEMAVIEETAAACGALYATTADGNAVADGRWDIDGTQFTQALGNQQLGEAERVQAGKKLLPEVRNMLRLTPTAGTDILGALDRAQLALAAIKGGQQEIVYVETDGVLNVAGRGGYSLYQVPIDTPRRRAKFIDRLRVAGEIPDLGGAKVVLEGIGVGVGDRRLARAVVVLWQQLVPAMNGHLVSIDAAVSSI